MESTISTKIPSQEVGIDILTLPCHPHQCSYQKCGKCRLIVDHWCMKHTERLTKMGITALPEGLTNFHKCERCHDEETVICDKCFETLSAYHEGWMLESKIRHYDPFSG
jgi:hypothetical protein